ncbi:M24 family metallopeptidase [Bdellovibrio sp. HCB117]|uniref:M24 family metallopeptidase n=1 Tax=Bdellovibrio sp. HCB117 TaxID=3394359 RepID=UPI0039B3BCD7
MSEAVRKIDIVRELMKAHDLEAVLLKGVDWFSWVTGGGNSVVIYTSEVGVAEVLITQEKAWVLTDAIERERLLNEEVPPIFALLAFPWENINSSQDFVHQHLKISRCASDRPSSRELPLHFDFHKAKMTLGDDEVERYRKLGKDAAEAMTEALSFATPEWTEFDVASEGARSLLRRGIDPTLVMVGSHRRMQIYRHPIATEEKIGDAAMMVFCARQGGLYANLTRFVYFRKLKDEEKRHHQHVMEVENAVLKACLKKPSMSSLYQVLKSSYAQRGYPEEVHRHHQGGLTGYLSREHVARPESPEDFRIFDSCAVAWNPTLPGAKIEDTILVNDKGLEILTVDERWPTQEYEGLRRPQPWIKEP